VARVVVTSGLWLADGVPMAIEHAALPAECAGVLADDLENGSLHESLTARGRVPSVSRSWIRARIATAVESRLLELPRRAALLVERRIIYDTDELPLEHTETAYNADNYAIDAVFSVSPSASLPNSAAPIAPA
jgi:GntR family transcriptional regulator